MNATATKTSSKNAPAAAQTVQTASAFWTSLARHVTPIEKLSSSQAQQDPTLAMRTRFVNKVAEQVKLIQSAASKSRWFTKLPDGSYELSVRNSNMALALGDKTYFKAADAAAAVAFLEAISNGAKAGELDAQLKATTRKPPTKKAAAPAAASAAQK
jgi:hypothetical protein